MSKPTVAHKGKRALQVVQQGGTDLLYSLIQPQRVPERAKPPPRLVVEILVTVLGLLGWGLFLRYYDLVLPSASLDLRYDRSQIARLAEDYVQERGFDVEGYRRVVTFDTDGMVQIYLERTVGVPALNRLVQDRDVSVWTWYVRWFVPEQRQEYAVRLLPSGEVVGFGRVLAEDAPRQAIPPAKAQQLAEEYLVGDRGLSLDDWELYDVSAETLPNRTDHTLTWVKRGSEIGKGDLRTSVTIQGAEVGRFDTWFRVPEAFSRDYTGQRSRAFLLDDLATGVAGLFLVGGLLVVLWGFTTGLRMGWTPVIAGLAAGLVDLLDSLNYLPLIDAGYDTAYNYQSYILGRLAAYVGSALYMTLFVAFLVLAVRWLLRAVWPRQYKLKPDPRAPWSHLARSGWRGMMVGGLMATYLILFYTAATRLGAWSPARTPPLNLLATPFPFVAAIWLGLLPALREELTYRALGIGLTMRLSGGRVALALFVPSLLWGFAHASYVSDPIGLRGIELTISSLLLTGLFFLLFDLTTSIVAHYTYNASLLALVLVRSGQFTFILTGLLAVSLGLLPVAILFIRRLRGRRREASLGLTVSVGGEEDRLAAEALGGERLPGADSPQRLVCLCSTDGQLLGYGLGLIKEHRSEAKIGEISALFVARPYRGRYCGTALYRALAEWFREQGIGQVQVRIPLGNAGASTFWSTQRFRPRARVWSKDV